jgi:hypothetical protein
MADPPLKAIVGTDFASLMAVVAAPVVLVVAAAVALRLPVSPPSRVLRDADLEAMDPGAAWIFVAMLPVVALLAALVLALRVRAIRRAFAGMRSPGSVTRVRPFKDRAWVSYRYVAASAERDLSRLVHLNARTRALKEGDTVTIAFDPARPAYGWIVQAFVGDSTGAPH